MDDPLYVGAVRKTSATAELNGCIETLFWLLSQLQSSCPYCQKGDKIILIIDCLYVVKLLRGKCSAKENKLQ
eukprot:5573236-Karenia_brevis.AAC.1